MVGRTEGEREGGVGREGGRKRVRVGRMGGRRVRGRDTRREGGN